MCINGPDHFTGEGPLTIATVCVLPLKLYQISTVELPSLADRYCQRAVATGEVSTKIPSLYPPLGCWRSAPTLGCDGREKPEVGVA